MPITEPPRFTSGHCVATVWPLCGHCVATVWPLGVCHAAWEINAPDAIRNQRTQSMPWQGAWARARAGERAFDLRRNTSQSDQTGKSCLLSFNMVGKPREFALAIFS